MVTPPNPRDEGPTQGGEEVTEETATTKPRLYGLVRMLRSLAPSLVAFLSAFLIGALHTATYFRNDDFEWVTLAKTFADSPWIPFTDASAQVAGFYRPVVVLTWILGFHLWGTDPTGYALLLSTVFGFANLLLYHLVALLRDRTTGLLAALIFATFFPTMLTTWWRSLLTSGVGLLFLLLSLYLFVRGFRRGSPRLLIVATLTSVLAFLSKESNVILPIFLMVFLLLYEKRDSAFGNWRWGIPAGLALLAYVLMFWLPAQLPQNYPFSSLGYSYEAASSLGQSLDFIAWNAISRGVDYLLIYWTYIGFTLIASLLMLGGALIVRGVAVLRGPGRALALSALWAVFGLLPALGMLFTQDRYMMESALGVSFLVALLAAPGVVAAGSALRSALIALRAGKRREIHAGELVPIGSLAVSAILLTSLGFTVYSESVGHLTFVEDQTQNLKEGLEFIADAAPSNSEVFVAVPSSVIHIPNIFRLGLEINGRPDIQVRALEAEELMAAVDSGLSALYVVVPEEVMLTSLPDGVLETLSQSFELLSSFERPRGVLLVYQVAT